MDIASEIRFTFESLNTHNVLFLENCNYIFRNGKILSKLFTHNVLCIEYF